MRAARLLSHKCLGASYDGFPKPSCGGFVHGGRLWKAVLRGLVPRLTSRSLLVKLPGQGTVAGDQFVDFLFDVAIVAWRVVQQTAFEVG